MVILTNENIYHRSRSLFCSLNKATNRTVADNKEVVKKLNFFPDKPVYNDFIFFVGDGDLLIITADHGCDPGFPGTDHTREYVPLLVFSKQARQGVDLSTRSSFADVGKTIADLFGLDAPIDGASMAEEIF